jgi:hypothetical protein
VTKLTELLMRVPAVKLEAKGAVVGEAVVGEAVEGALSPFTVGDLVVREAVVGEVVGGEGSVEQAFSACVKKRLYQ